MTIVVNQRYGKIAAIGDGCEGCIEPLVLLKGIVRHSMLY